MSHLNPKFQDMIRNGIALTAQEAIMIERIKGCDSAIYTHPVEIEPAFFLFREPNFIEPTIRVVPNIIVPAIVNHSHETVQIFFKPEQQPHWSIFEALVKSLGGVKSPLVFTIQGNSKRIIHSLTYDKELANVINTALKSHFPHAWFQKNSGGPLKTLATNKDKLTPWFSNHYWDFQEYYPATPYWSDMTIFSTKDRSPLIPVYTALSQLVDNEKYFYQVIFEPVRNDWRTNIQRIRALEQAISLDGVSGIAMPFHKDSSKTSPEQILFAAIIRIGIETNTDVRLSSILNSLGITLQPFMTGGYPMMTLSKQAFLKAIKDKNLVREMILGSLCYRTGMIVSSKELSGFCHFPDTETLKSPLFHCDVYHGSLPVQSSKESGIILGLNNFDKQLILPERVRDLPIVIFGKTGKGKSHLLLTMILNDIAAGRTVVVIEPHGDLILDILSRIPQFRINDTTLVDLTDKHHTFSYNPV